MSEIGHNSTVSVGQLRSYIERVERLEGEIKDLQADKKEIYGEAKANGFDATIMRKVVQRRRMDPAARAEIDSLVEVYEDALS